jgi:exodeoxyribonuclease VII large subunit
MKNKKIIYTVSEISNKIEDAITSNFKKEVKIQGEISNVKIFKGNVYMTLKDPFTTIKVVMWAYNKNGDKPTLKDGCQVILTGIIKTYSRSSNYQLNAFDVVLFGVGDFHSQYNKLKTSFEKRGYFDNKNKKALPDKIKNVGIITSTDGAALKDILFVLDKNLFNGNVFVRNCYVQGPSCAKTVIDGIKYFTEFKNDDDEGIDVIIMSRGGGSFEDLFGFSDEKLVEEIYKSEICIISAVGHEIDNMLSDYVADVRAPTPSVAGEIIAAHQKKVIDEINYINQYIKYKLYGRINSTLFNFKNIIYEGEKILKKPEDIIKEKEREINFLNQHINNYTKNKLKNYTDRLENLKNGFNLLDPKKILNKGYSVIMDNKRNTITNILQLKDEKELIVKMKDGEYLISVNKIKKILKENNI